MNANPTYSQQNASQIKKIAAAQEAEKAYTTKLHHAKAAAAKIARLLDEMPAKCNGDWSQVGTAGRIESELQQLLDMLQGTGEYAN